MRNKIFDLAIKQVKREGKIEDKNVGYLILDRAYRILKYFDIQERNKKVTISRKMKV